MKKFNHKAKNFSKVNLAYLAHCANFVYKGKRKISTELKKLGFDLSRDNYYFSSSKTDTQAFVVGDENKIIVCFRGTEGKFADWLTDANLIKKKWTKASHKGDVHSGFYGALSSIWKDVYKEVVTLRTNKQSIWITGHSLGGALAALSAATFELQKPRLSINGVYTFGQPRIANHKFSKKYNNKLKDITFRCVNNNDVVTRVPPQAMGYRHVGKLMYFDTKGKLRRDGSLTWWNRFWDRVEGRFDDILDLTPDGIGDHSMNKYQKLSEKNSK